MIVLVVIAALFFDLTNGWHDSANSIATVVSTRALPPWLALAIAATLNFVGALVGTAVAKRIGGGIVEPTAVNSLFVVFATLISASLWSFATMMMGLPVSSSHSLIGSLIGSAVAAGGFGVFHPEGIYFTLGAMLVAPILGFAAAFFMFVALLWIARGMTPGRGKRVFGFLQIVSSSFMSWAHGQNDAQKVMGIITLALIVAGNLPVEEDRPTLQIPVSSDSASKLLANERVMKISARYSISRRGDSDEIVLLSAEVKELDKYRGDNPAELAKKMEDVLNKVTGIPLWVKLACAAAMALGTAFGGWRVIRTLGMKLAKITVVEGFVAETAAGAVLETTALLGAPVSTTQTITGAILGVSSVIRFRTVRWGLGAKIVYAWLLTLPVCFCMGWTISKIGVWLGL